MKILCKIFALSIISAMVPLLQPLAAQAYSNADLAAVEKGASCPGGDLSGADLSGYNLSGRDFAGTDFTEARLDGTSLGKA